MRAKGNNILHLKSEQLSVEIKSRGAEVSGVRDMNGTEFMFQAKKEIWPRHAPVLFPIVGKLKDNQLNCRDKSYELGQHGFARDREFSVINKKDNAVTFELRSDEQSLKIYPFDFILQITYTLDGNALTTAYRVLNPSAGKLMFSIGAHPGFRVPLLPDESFSDYYIEFEHDTFIQTALRDGLRSESSKVLPLVGKKLFLSDTLFDNDALVFENHQISGVSLASLKSKHRITLACKDWPYFGIWSKKGCAEFVCLEPWYGITDHVNSTGVFDKKEGLIHLDGGGEFNCRYSTIFA